jgi:hypothetical protein
VSPFGDFRSISSMALAVLRQRNPNRMACDGWQEVRAASYRLLRRALAVVMGLLGISVPAWPASDSRTGTAPRLPVAADRRLSICGKLSTVFLVVVVVVGG